MSDETLPDDFENEINKYDKDIILDDNKEYENVTPEYYLKRLIILSQNALIKDNLDTGLIQYRIIIEDMEKTAEANKLLDDDYFTEINRWIKDDIEYNDPKTSLLIKNTKLANKKKFEIMKRFFSHRPVTADLFI
jgi:hypothetical protein